jgi:3-oxoacyl-[acyl-carrier protein] reductase
MRTAVVLGASKGIGRGCAERLAADGHRVVLFGRDEKALADAKQRLAPAESWTCAGDVGSKEDLERLFAQVEARFGGCDILVNNNSGPPAGDVLAISDEAWTAAFSQYALPVFRAIRLVVPRMRAKKWGRIITIGSLSVKQPIENLDLSNFMRAGLAATLKPLSRKLAADQITVHLVCPGSILTDRSRQRIQERAEARGVSFDESLRISEAAIPIGRLGTPEEIGELVAFLASDRARFLTGNVIQVDGGQSTGLF